MEAEGELKCCQLKASETLRLQLQAEEVAQQKIALRAKARNREERLYSDVTKARR